MSSSIKSSIIFRTFTNPNYSTMIHMYGNRYFASKAGNHYEVLGVSTLATSAEIKGAYYELSKKYHPDVCNSTEGREKFTAICLAYETLGNPISRHMYDRGTHTSAEMNIDKALNRKGKQYKDDRARIKFDRGESDQFHMNHYPDSIRKKKDQKEAMKEYDKEKELSEGDFQKFAVVVGAVFGVVLMFLIK